jgi:tetratricopeptide (TPR) repeat protein
MVGHHLEATPTLENTQRAVRIQPLDADHQAMLGVMLMESGQFDDARAHLERAVAIDPYSSRVWLMLADAYEVLGDDALRANAVRHAITAEPKDTQVQWQAANLFLATDLDRSLQLLRGVVENDPQSARAAMQVAYRATGGNIDKAMLAIPLATQSRLQFMHWLVEREQNDAADHVWPTLLRAPGPLEPRDVFFYLDSLVARHQPSQAFAAWTALAQRDSRLRADLQSGNLISNGDFEGDLLNGGFGWRYVPTTGVTASLDTSTFHGGTRSLALQIDGEDLQDFGFRQQVKVDAGARYHLSAWLHAEDLQAAFGVRIAVADAYSHQQLVLSEEALGSFPWHEIDADLAVPADTELVNVSLVRSPSTGRIRGKLWLDDLRIEKH